jgi:hypothetical protein
MRQDDGRTNGHGRAVGALLDALAECVGIAQEAGIVDALDHESQRFGEGSGFERDQDEVFSQ